MSMKTAFAIIFLLAAQICFGACPPAKVTVSDTLYDQTGALLNGTVTVTNSLAFTSADGCAIAQGARSITTVTNGVFSIQLVPNANSIPSGTSYTVDYSVTSSSRYREVWVIPASGPVTVAGVRSAIPPVPPLILAVSQLAPPNPCLNNQILTWANNAWACTTSGGGGGSGTVTSFSSQATLTPLFTTNVATPTTTPALSFTLSNAGAHTFYGNTTGSSAAPLFSAITSPDLPTVPVSKGGTNNTSAGSNGQVLICNGTDTCAPGDPVVSGPDVPGVTPTRPPVQIGAFDGTNIQRVLSSVAGRLSVDVNSAPTTTVNGTITVNGTVTANAGSGTFNTQQSNVTADYDTGAGTQTTTMYGLALPASGGAVAGGTATNPIQVSLANTAANSTAVKIDGSAVTQPVSGTLTANAGTNLNTSALALDTSVNGILLSQGSVTSGQKGHLNQGAVTTAAPTYTTGQTSPLSLTTSGALRTDNSAVIQPVSGTVTANQGGAWTVQPGNTPNTTAWKVDGSAVTQPVSGSVTANIGTSGSLALDASVTGLQVSQGSTSSGQKGSLSQGAVTTSAPSYTTAQTSPLSLDPSGNLRTSVNNTVTVSGSVGISAGSNTVGKVDQGNAGTNAQAWWAELGDTTNGPVAVKAASTAVAAADKSLAVGLSPNSPLPAGTNVIGHAIIDTGSTTAATQATASNFNAQVVGSIASGSADSGNPIKTGGTFNTTQPTVTNAQRVDAQYSARGSALVTPGVEGFTVTSTQGTAAASTAGWPIIGGNIAESTAAWTSATAQNTTLRMTVTGYNSVTVFLNQGTTITGGVVSFEVSDTTAFTNAYSLQCVTANAFTVGTTYTLVASTNQAFNCDTSGYAAFQVKLSTVITGSATVNVGIEANAMSTAPDVAIGGTVIQGSANTISNAWPVKITDGTNSITVKAASTASVATDTSEVVALSPNSPVPTGTNTIGKISDITTTVTPGTAAANLGKAEDAASVSGDTGVFTLGIRNDGSSTQTTSANGDYSQVSVDAYGTQFARLDHPNRVQCTADNIAATLTQLTNCGAPGAGLSIYISDIIAESTTATGGAMTLEVGTGSNCGTGTAALYPPVSTSRTVFAPANTNTTGPLQIHFMTPLKAAANNAVCVLGVATNTTNIMVQGYIAP